MFLAAPYIVVDQNAFRDPMLLGPALKHARDTGARLLVIDAAMLEMTKHPDRWESTMRQSLAPFAACPELVALGRGVPDLMKQERDEGRPAHTQLEETDRTPGFRNLVVELQCAEGGPNLEYLRTKIVAAQRQISYPQYLDDADNRRRLIEFSSQWRSLLPDPRDRSRVGDDRSVQVNLLAHPTWGRAVERLILESGHSLSAARRIAYDRSVSAHWTLAYAALVLQLLLKHDRTRGLETRASWKSTNDLIDVDYVATGSLCVDVLSHETLVKNTTALVRDAAEIRSRVYAEAEAGGPYTNADLAFKAHLEATPRSV